jgi:hypothetical protein
VSTTAERYRRFAREAAPRSRTYAAWALAIADDEECLALIDTLPVADRQPVLVLSAARFSGLSSSGDIRAWLEGEWDAVAQIARQRATQTNDPRRTAPLLAALQGIPGPIALLEVGASAGLGLLVDHYSHVFVDAEGGERCIDPVDGPSLLELRCQLGEGVPVPTEMPDIVWRAGLERSPLRLTSAEDERWLRTLIWPEERERAAQLDAAITIAREHVPHLVAGDAVDGLAALAEHAPHDATLVVASPAVLVYLSPADRARFVATVTGLPGHWVSLDGRRVLPEVGEAADEVLPGADDDFVLSRDGRPLAIVSPHGEVIERWAEGGLG